MMRLMEADQIKFDQIRDLVKTAASRLMIRCRTSVNVERRFNELYGASQRRLRIPLTWSGLQMRVRNCKRYGTGSVGDPGLDHVTT
jgi:hypothetical protein